ncbi:saccharopine dehydrogenase family protein [Phyllobacterium ifriqiyense]|uniref:saccharopine dehydrogenase family protein n=1 Tax=Phyllobacterium ifriqiyense TaxID=314238 RepID=UPI003396E2CD
MSEFEVIVYGASGFTGELVCAHLVENYGSQLRWAMAGRDHRKLIETHSRIGAPSNVGLITVDLESTADVAALVKRTDGLITTAGPFATIGEPLLAACVRQGIAYVDLSGDAVWIRRMIDRYEEVAKSTGGRIIFSAGFDSVPSDLGVRFLQTIAKERFGSCARRVKGRVMHIAGSLSGGSIASARASASNAVEDDYSRTLLADPFALVPGFSGPMQPNETAAVFDDDVGWWVVPFIMSGINVKTVHRSNALLGHPYGTDFIYDEMLVYPKASNEHAATRQASVDEWSNRDLIAVSPLKPGDGPDAALRNSGGYQLLFVGLLEDERRVDVTVEGVGDPGYRSTSRIVVETMLSLLKDGVNLPGGMWTASAALGATLQNRLELNAGLSFREVDH